MLVHYAPMNDRHEYDYVEYPNELSLEEKDQLLFALAKHLGLCILRAKFDPTATILTRE